MAAKCAIDGALHDLVGKLCGQPLWRILGLDPVAPPTSYTISIDTVEGTAGRARRAAAYHALKIKVGGPDDLERVRAVRREAPNALIRVDANEAWTVESTTEICPELVALNVELIEQPLPDGDREGYDAAARREAAAADHLDESCHTLPDVAAAYGHADGINIKLTKSGGIREALRMIHAARALDLKVMLGCMNESSLGIAGAVQISPLVDIVDLDGHLLNTNDAFTGLGYENGAVTPSDLPGLGVTPLELLAVTRYVILAEGGFVEHDAKTGTGVLRYGADPCVAVIDSTRAGTRVRDHIRGLDSDVPVVAVAGRGDGLRAEHAADRRGAGRRQAARGLEVRDPRGDRTGASTSRAACTTSSSDDPELASAAAAAGVELRDLRKPPAGLDVPTGDNLTVDAYVVATVGSDCALGKMTVCLELDCRGPAARPPQRLRPDRADRHRDRGVGDRGRRGGVRLRRRRLGAAGAGGRRAGRTGSAALDRGPGLDQSPRLLRGHAGPAARVGAARRWCWCTSRPGC